MYKFIYINIFIYSCVVYMYVLFDIPGTLLFEVVLYTVHVCMIRAHV